LAFVPEGTQSVSVATAIGMKATNGLVDANSGLSCFAPMEDRSCTRSDKVHRE
jgi:hypothetical protein